MRVRVWACLLAFVTATTFAATPADGDPPFGFPVGPVTPPPAPNPGGVLTLTGDSLLVVQFKADTVLRAHPAGLVKATKEVGPIRIRARFADGDGKVETRVYTGPCVWFVEAVGKGRVEMDAIPVGFKLESEITASTVVVDGNLAPQPPPDDGKKDPAPAPKQVIAWVVVVEETQQRTADTAKVLGDLAYWQSLAKRDPAISFRHYDKDSPDAKLRNFDTFGAEVGLPAVLFLAADGKVIKVTGADGKEKVGFKLPKTTTEISDKIKEVGR